MDDNESHMDGKSEGNKLNRTCFSDSVQIHSWMSAGWGAMKAFSHHAACVPKEDTAIATDLQVRLFTHPKGLVLLLPSYTVQLCRSSTLQLYNFTAPLFHNPAVQACASSEVLHTTYSRPGPSEFMY